MLETSTRRDAEIDRLITERASKLTPRAAGNPRHVDSDQGRLTPEDEYVVKIRGNEIARRLTTSSLSGTHYPEGPLPQIRRTDAEILRWK